MKQILKAVAEAEQERRGVGKRKETKNMIVNPKDHEAAEHLGRGDNVYYRIATVANGLPNLSPRG